VLDSSLGVGLQQQSIQQRRIHQQRACAQTARHELARQRLDAGKLGHRFAELEGELAPRPDGHPRQVAEFRSIALQGNAGHRHTAERLPRRLMLPGGEQAHAVQGIRGIAQQGQPLGAAAAGQVLEQLQARGESLGLHVQAELDPRHAQHRRQLRQGLAQFHQERRTGGKALRRRTGFSQLPGKASQAPRQGTLAEALRQFAQRHAQVAYNEHILDG
jgi:hypothetical protein